MGNLDYGVVGNCRTAALISKEGSIDWLCMPEFDSSSVFAALLDKEKGGSFGFEIDGEYTVKQKYLPNTNILSTTFITETGVFEVLDFMPRYHTQDDSYYLPPELYRSIRIHAGAPVIKINYNPAPDYAQHPTESVLNDKYIESRCIKHGRENIYLYSDLPLKDIFENKEITLTKDCFLLLSYNEKMVKVNLERVELEYQRTKVYWLNWNNRSKKYACCGDTINRSILILKLMSYQSGAVLAALTTSLPEVIGGVRNWDYRFCWLRDASMSIEMLLKTGHKSAAMRFIKYVQNIFINKNANFQIMYGIRGEKHLREKELRHLSGFKNSKPVRIGNEAYTQKQNDSLGYLTDVILQYYCFFPGTLDEIEGMWEIVKNIVHTVKNTWDKPDKGIWEIRGQERHFVFSKVMSWVALDRAARIAALTNQAEYAEQWRNDAEMIKQDILTNGWNEELKSFTQVYGGKDLDSSLLLMERYGFLPADDPKYIQTVDAVKNSLMYDGLMYRYNNEDDFGRPESSFTICNFWLVRALFVTGRQQEAREMFDRLLSYANHLGLFSEDLDFKTKEQLGNFPQAYSHLAVIDTCLLFCKEEQLSRFIRP